MISVRLFQRTYMHIFLCTYVCTFYGKACTYLCVCGYGHILSALLVVLICCHVHICTCSVLQQSHSVQMAILIVVSITNQVIRSNLE